MRRRPRPLHALISLSLIATIGSLGAGPAAARARPTPRLAPQGPTDPAARGLIYRGLTPARPDRTCWGSGLLEIRSSTLRFLGCTHGPDPAPTGVDVRVPRSVSKLRATTPATSTGVPCIGDGVSGNRVQAIYAVASGQTDRYSSVAPLIRTWAAQVNDVFAASAAETGGQRQVRFVTTSGSPCTLDVDHVTLTAAGDDSFANTINDLRNQGYTQSNRKFLVWVDANLLCGIAQIYNDDSTSNNLNDGNAAIQGEVTRVDNGCWGLLPVDASVEGHELEHNLGAVQHYTASSVNHFAPNSTSNHHCSDEWDTMCYADGSPGLVLQYPCPYPHERLLDCHHDDYFNTNPSGGSYLATHWNTSSNSFLASGLPPVNDVFAGAEALPGSPTVLVGSNVGASAETGEPSIVGQAAAHSVWYQFTAPSGGTLTVDTQGSGFDTVLGVYTGGAVGGLTERGANDDSGGQTYSRVAVSVTGGTAYSVKVDGKGGATGSLYLHVGFGGAGPMITGFSPAAAPVGRNVTITGTNLIGNGSNIRLQFNGTYIAAISCGTTCDQLIVQVPSGATTGPITLATSYGYSQADTNFVVKPKIKTFTPSSGPVGTVVTVKGSAFLGATKVTFNGVNATFNSVAYGSLKATVPAGATTGRIQVTTPSGKATSKTDFTVT